MADLTPEARRKAADALLAYITGRWVVCDHAQILDAAGAVDAVVDALDRHDADEVERLRAELAEVTEVLTVTGEKLDAVRGQRDRAEAERDEAREQVKRVADEAEARAAKQAFNDPYEYGQAIGLRAVAAGLREVLDGTGDGS